MNIAKYMNSFAAGASEFWRREKVVVLFFALYFFVGMFVLRDFGVSWDELYQDAIGHFNLQYVTGKDTHLLDETNTAKFAAPLYEMFIGGTGRVLGVHSASFEAVGQFSMYYRHFLNFCTFFIGVIFFYLLCLRMFKNKYFGLLGASFLIMTPRLFADQFYNSKDGVFLALFIITFYFLIRFMERPSTKRIVWLAIMTGITFGVRVGVLFIPVFAFLYLGTDYILTGSRHLSVKHVCLYVVITLIVIFGTYPVMWSNPIQNFISLIKFFGYQPNNVPNLYFGTYVPAFELPWHFIPVWISITTPPIYLILFLTGLLSLIMNIQKGVVRFFVTRREDVLVLLWFFVPLFMVIVGHSVLYNSWRHMFFIYPAFIIMMIHGILFIRSVLLRYIPQHILAVMVCIALFGNFVYVGWRMTELHPYEHLYFNFLAGTDMNTVRKNFDMDYWGLTYKQGLENLIRYDKGNKVVVIADFPARANSYILSSQDQSRVFVGFPWDIKKPIPKYFMTNFFFSQKEFPYKVIYTVRVKGADILKVYELPESAGIRFDGTFIYR